MKGFDMKMESNQVPVSTSARGGEPQSTVHSAPETAAKGRRDADFAQEITDAMASENVERIVELFAPDGEWVIMSTGETFRGHDEIRRLAGRSLAARNHPVDLNSKPERTSANSDGAKLSLEYVHRGVVEENSSSSAGRPAPGTKVELQMNLVCEFRHGKLRKVKEYLDLRHIVEPEVPPQQFS
jgi:ketosteroid isomerase-like protein